MIHNMKLQSDPFEKIANGSKTYELRLYDSKRQQVHSGDSIIFTNMAEPSKTLKVLVTGLQFYMSFEELFDDLPMEVCGYENGTSVEDAVLAMRDYYSEEDEEEYGCLAIEVRVLREDEDRENEGVGARTNAADIGFAAGTNATDIGFAAGTNAADIGFIFEAEAVTAAAGSPDSIKAPSEINTRPAHRIKIEPLPLAFSVCKVEDYSQVSCQTHFLFPQRTEEENSLVCLTQDVPANTTDREDGWKAFRIKGSMDFSLIGILAGISKVMAENGIGIFALSTFNTDYILVKKESFEAAGQALKAAGYVLLPEPELFDIVDDQGMTTGRTVLRDLAHRYGIPHRTAHIWIVRKYQGRNQILLQKRAMNKDSFPGCYDTSSAGHIQAGDEPFESARRELFEELGIEAKAEDLIPAGTFRIAYASEFHGKPFQDDETAFVFIYKNQVEVTGLTLQEEEVESVRWFDVDYVSGMLDPRGQEFCVPKEGFLLVKKWCEQNL